jgi:DNA-binding transcriptional ArsR family regulator
VRKKLVLTRLDQLRALAEPLRFKMVETLIAAEQSATGLARALGVPTTRLYHHLELLEKAGLIKVVRQVRRRGVDERVYQAAAHELTIAANLLAMNPDPSQSKESLLSLARSVLGAAFDELVDGINAGRVRPSRAGSSLVLEHRRLALSPAGIAALARELPAWMEGFERRHPPSRRADYRVVFAAFPAAPKRSGRGETTGGRS